jgi:hypothetical protein
MRRSLDEYREFSVRQLANRVFVYDSSTADEKFFRQGIYELIIGQRPHEHTYREFLWKLIYERSNSGRTSKYLHFNDWTQRLSVDWAFQAWAEKVCDEIECRLKETA